MKLQNLRNFIEIASKEIAEDVAETVVYDLKRVGPYYSGDFEESWVVRSGDVDIPANRRPVERPNKRRPRQVTAVAIPDATIQNGVVYTIGNQMVYRAIAMDIVPGRVKNPDTASAVQDWYALYVDGGVMAKRVAATTKKALSQAKKQAFS